MSQTYKVLRNEKVGRYVVAAKALKAGETVLVEKPFAIGPKTGSSILCLGCLKPVDGTILCPKCSWPVCSLECSQRQEHQGECKEFSFSKAKYQEVEDTTSPCAQYECITPLRVLLAMEADMARWESEISLMESHCSIRSKQPIWQTESINVVTYLREACKLAKRFSEELIHKVCGILEVNSFEVITEESFAVRGLYPQAAILSHNCVANTCHTIVPSQDYKMFLRTTVDIQNDEELFSSYTGSLQPTLVRRENLRFAKYFSCSCARCSDPRELGTNMSTLKCTKCDNGVILSTNPLDRKAVWRCTHCDFAVTGHGVKRIYIEIKNEISKLEDMEFGPERLEMGEKLLRQYRSVLHPNHALLAELKHCLIPLYGRVEGYTMDELPDIMLERKADYCKKLLDLLDVIEPGLTRIRGLTLYEYHAVALTYAKSRYQRKDLTPEELKAAMNLIKCTLSHSVRILSLEPETSPEGMLARQAAISLKELSKSIDSL